MSVVCDKKQFKEFMDASNQRVAVAVEKAKTALAAHEAAQGDAGDAVAACPVCNGTGVIFGHSDDCADDLCALNGDMHSCAGQVHQCDCRATQPPAVESGPSDEDLFRVAAETLPHRGKRTPFGLIAFESPDYARAMCIEDGVRWTYTELRSEDYLKLARALLSAFPAAQPQPTGEEIRRDAELLSKYADEINALRNVIQLACIDGLEGLARGWSKYFPDSPITIKGLPQQTDAAIEAVRKALCKIPKYSFQIDNRGNLRRNEDSAGNWIEFAAAHALFDPVEVDAAIAASKETPQ